MRTLKMSFIFLFDSGTGTSSRYWWMVFCHSILRKHYMTHLFHFFDLLWLHMNLFIYCVNVIVVHQTIDSLSSCSFTSRNNNSRRRWWLFGKRGGWICAFVSSILLQQRIIGVRARRELRSCFNLWGSIAVGAQRTSKAGVVGATTTTIPRQGIGVAVCLKLMNIPKITG